MKIFEMKTKVINLIKAAFLVLVLAGCSKDFLDLEPTDAISEDRLSIPRWSIPLRSGLMIVELMTSKNSYQQKIIISLKLFNE